MNARPRPLMTLPRRAEYGNLRVDGVDDDPFGQYRTRKPVTASRGSGTFHVRSNPPQWPATGRRSRSEEHTSELQSRLHLVCRLLLEKKKNHNTTLQNVGYSIRPYDRS